MLWAVAAVLAMSSPVLENNLYKYAASLRGSSVHNRSCWCGLIKFEKWWSKRHFKKVEIGDLFCPASLLRGEADQMCLCSE